MKMDQNTAIVTGASSGIGLGITKALIKRGYRVVANSRNISSSGALPPSANLELVDGDIGQPGTGARLVDIAVERFGSAGLLVNNAGMFIPKPFIDYTADDAHALVSTNLWGFIHATQPAVAQMLRQGFGHIVTISTMLVDQPLAAVPAVIPILIKGGLNAATRALAIEYASHNIRVNVIAAGIIDTPMHKPETHEFLKTLHPIQRLGSVGEIADAVVYLTKATFVSGEVLHVDGGAHAGRW